MAPEGDGALLKPMPVRRAFLTLLVFLGCGLFPSRGATPTVSEAAVKAAFVYNFAKFAEWPGEGPTTPHFPIRLCLYGSRDPFLAALGDIDGKAAQGRPIRIHKAGQPADIPGCHILVVAESERHQASELFRAAQETGSLTVGEWSGFIEAGGIIGLVVDNDRVQFEVNLEAARRNDVRLSSQLLKLARRVRR